MRLGLSPGTGFTWRAGLGFRPGPLSVLEGKARPAAAELAAGMTKVERRKSRRFMGRIIVEIGKVADKSAPWQVVYAAERQNSTAHYEASIQPVESGGEQLKPTQQLH